MPKIVEWYKTLPPEVWGEGVQQNGQQVPQVGYTGAGPDGVVQPNMPSHMIHTPQGPVMLHEGENTIQGPNGQVQVVPQGQLQQIEQQGGVPGMQFGGLTPDRTFLGGERTPTGLVQPISGTRVRQEAPYTTYAPTPVSVQAGPPTVHEQAPPVGADRQPISIPYIGQMPEPVGGERQPITVPYVGQMPEPVGGERQPVTIPFVEQPQAYTAPTPAPVGAEAPPPITVVSPPPGITEGFWSQVPEDIRQLWHTGKPGEQMDAINALYERTPDMLKQYLPDKDTLIQQMGFAPYAVPTEPPVGREAVPREIVPVQPWEREPEDRGVGLSVLEQYATGQGPAFDAMVNRAITMAGAIGAASTGALRQEAAQAGLTSYQTGVLMQIRARDIAGENTKLMAQLAQEGRRMQYDAALAMVPHEYNWTKYENELLNEDWERALIAFDPATAEGMEALTSAWQGYFGDRYPEGYVPDLAQLQEMRVYAQAKRNQDVQMGDLDIDAAKLGISGDQMALVVRDINSGVPVEEVNANYGLNLDQNAYDSIAVRYRQLVEAGDIQNEAARLGVTTQRMSAIIDAINNGVPREQVNLDFGVNLSPADYESIATRYNQEVTMADLRIDATELGIDQQQMGAIIEAINNGVPLADINRQYGTNISPDAYDRMAVKYNQSLIVNGQLITSNNLQNAALWIEQGDWDGANAFLQSVGLPTVDFARGRAEDMFRLGDSISRLVGNLPDDAPPALVTAFTDLYGSVMIEGWKLGGLQAAAPEFQETIETIRDFEPEEDPEEWYTFTNYANTAVMSWLEVDGQQLWSEMSQNPETANMIALAERISETPPSEVSASDIAQVERLAEIVGAYHTMLFGELTDHSRETLQQYGLYDEEQDTALQTIIEEHTATVEENARVGIFEYADQTDEVKEYIDEDRFNEITTPLMADYVTQIVTGASPLPAGLTTDSRLYQALIDDNRISDQRGTQLEATGTGVKNRFYYDGFEKFDSGTKQFTETPAGTLYEFNGMVMRYDGKSVAGAAGKDHTTYYLTDVLTGQRYIFRAGGTKNSVRRLTKG